MRPLPYLSRPFGDTGAVVLATVLAMVGAASASCHARGRGATHEPGTTPSVVRRTVRAARVGPRFADPALRESSGLAASGRVPGLLWTMNDGGEPELFAVAARDGRVLARVRVAGAGAVDWEAIARGPCGPAGGGGRPAAAECLYVGDVGDNAAFVGGPSAGRAGVTLYRVPEPAGAPGPPGGDALGSGALGGGASGARGGPPRLPPATAPAAALAVRYADGPRDVEAMAVFPDGDAWLITKHPARRPDGAPRPALVYRVPVGAWAGAAAGAAAGAPAVARLVDSLPVVPDRTITHRVTDAAFDAGRRLLAVRTYRDVYLVPVAGPPWRVDRGRAATACGVGVLREPQGEGVAFAPGPAVTLVLSSETNLLGAGGLAAVRCPPPA